MKVDTSYGPVIIEPTVGFWEYIYLNDNHIVTLYEGNVILEAGLNAIYNNNNLVIKVFEKDDNMHLTDIFYPIETKEVIIDGPIPSHITEYFRDLRIIEYFKDSPLHANLFTAQRSKYIEV